MDVPARYRGFLFAKLGKLLNKEQCSMPAGTKVELESMEKQLELLLEKYNIIGDVPLYEVEAAESAWLCHTKKLFCDAEVLVDFLLVPTECSEPAANPDGLSTTSPEIADAKIKKITERGLLLMRLLFKEGPNLRALYKQEEETELVGIDGPRDELIKVLATSENELENVFITGIAGSGKTTLARVVYNQLKAQFDCGAFVRVPGFVYDDSEDDALKHSFLLEMLSQLDVENHMNVQKSAMDCSGLLDQVKQFLQNKRYLVVFDDICGPNRFNDVLSTLENDVYGSRIICTSRIQYITGFGLSVLDESVYDMKSLGYLDSRKLFLKQFPDCVTSFPTAPTDVLNEILKMCGGSPSVIISVASVLATRVTATKQWAEMVNSVYSALKQMASCVNFKSDHIVGFEEVAQILLLP
uniref:Uncharacterized protein n=1 Tax=Avena sativa TaxID=4498 RepID=A0ACD5Z3Y2_AVESA